MFLVVIYIYFAICFLILFYNIGFIVFKRYEQHSQTKYIKSFLTMFYEIQGDEYMDRMHIESLKKQLKRINKFIALEKAINQLKNNDGLSFYLSQLEPVIKRLVIDFKHRNQMEQAYLARFISTYAQQGKWHDPLIYKTLISYLDKGNVYLRESILQATYQQPDPKWIVHVFLYLTKHELFHHSKLIQDGLLSYPYNCEELIDALWAERETFHQHINLGIVGYITYKSSQYKERFYEMLLKNQLDLEMKIRLLRYFKRHYYSKMESLLISFATDKRDEIRIVTVQVLSAYKSEQVLLVLKRALKDSNFYVRRNASQSLIEMGISELDVLDVLSGQDRFAKEMIRYHLKQEGRESHELVH